MKDLYHYFDVEIADHNLDQLGQRRRLSQTGRKLYEDEVVANLFRLTRNSVVCKNSGDGNHCSVQQETKSSTVYQEVGRTRLATQIKSNIHTAPKQRSLTFEYTYDEPLDKICPTHIKIKFEPSHTFLRVTKNLEGNANYFWENRTTGVPSYKFFNDWQTGQGLKIVDHPSSYGDQHEWKKNWQPQTVYELDRSGNIQISSGFWKRAFSKESNTIAVEWTARALKNTAENHLHAPNFKEQVDFYAKDDTKSEEEQAKEKLKGLGKELRYTNI